MAAKNFTNSLSELPISRKQLDMMQIDGNL